jgi:tetratricopeptide (TPR) repeat protein
MNINDLLNSAMALHSQGNLNEAEKYYRAILSKHPEHIDALHYLGVIAFQVGQNTAAIELITKSLANDASNAAALGNLGNAYQGISEFGRAIEAYKKALTISPDNFQIRANLGNACKQIKRFEEAQQCYLQVLEKAPDLIEVQRNLAEVYAETGALPKAIETILEAVSRAPNSVEVRISCGNILKQVGNLKGAIEHYSAVVKQLPDDLNAKSSLGICLGEFGEFEQAIELLIEVTEKSANSAPPHYNLAFAYYEAGHFDLAVTCLRTSLRLDPDLVKARVLLCKCDQHQGGQENIKTMENLLNHSGIDAESKASLAYALSNHNEKQSQFDLAFKRLKFANDLSRKQTNYELEDDKRAFSNIIRAFDSSFFEKHNYVGDTQARPVFIVGMPRSGSTLVEQILSSHSAFFGIGEWPILANCLNQVFGLNNGIDCTSGVLAANNVQFEVVAHNYLEKTRSLNPDAVLLGDKLLMNFFHIGIIKLLFPNAIIIHCKRDPLSTCWSIYKSDFSRMGHYYGQTFSELGQFYRLYQNLMSHWHSVFPGAIYDITYENLVSDQEVETKKLLRACGLKWEPECLKFHKNNRRVATLSATQVRRPLYQTALASWKPFEKNISELITVLNAN